MLCILRMSGPEIAGWIVAYDIDDARRQAQGAGDIALATLLYRMTFAPPAGKHELPGGYIMLVA